MGDPDDRSRPLFGQAPRAEEADRPGDSPDGGAKTRVEKVGLRFKANLRQRASRHDSEPAPLARPARPATHLGRRLTDARRHAAGAKRRATNARPRRRDVTDWHSKPFFPARPR